MLKPDHDATEEPDVLGADDAADEEGVNHTADVGTSVDERSRASRLWLVAACLCLFAAAALWLLGYADAAFVVAALGVVSWFLNVRLQLKGKAKR